MTNGRVEKMNNGEVANKSEDINWQKFQEFWKSITTKPETISKRFNKPYQYQFSDVEDVHHRIVDAAKSYKLKGVAHNFIVYYSGGNNRTFNSFETLSAGVGAISSATKSITLEYNFIIEHPQTGSSGSYKVSVDLFSRLSDDDFTSFPKFMKNFFNTTGYVKIEYVDYSIAQNFINVVKDWFDSRKCAQEEKLIKFLQKYSEYIPSLFRGIFTMIFAYIVFCNVDKNLTDPTFKLLTQFIIINFTTIVIGRELIYKIGSIVEDNMDSLCQLTFINFTKGDQNLIESFREKKEKGIKKMIIFFIVEICVGISVSLINSFVLGKVINIH